MRRDSMDRAMDILKESARGFVYYHLVDEAGNMAGIESIDSGYTLMEPENGMMVHANHYETEAYKKTDLAYTYIPDSFGRADRLRELISSAAGSVTPEMMMEFLADHKNRPDSICSHVDESKPPEMASMSLSSLVMAPKERKMFVAFGPPCENTYQEYVL
ncbi:MAG: carcinine hydrolase/isopenicillin-N N-acyltransferase family protein [Desulfobacteraceae bacterium]